MIYLILMLILGTILGILAGVITGLIPGIHINLIAILLLGASAFFLSHISPLVLAVFIAAMAITHTFLDYLPSIFLGAPDEDTALSILPGHEMLVKGRAYEAVILTLYGSAAAIILSMLLLPTFIYLLPLIYNSMTKAVPFMIPLILLIASAFLFYFEKKSKLWAIIIFILAGLLGIASLNLNVKEPLLPMLTGLFGASALITSIIKKQKIPKQKIFKLKHIKINKKSIFRSLLASLIASPLVSFLPGLGPGQAAVIGSEVTGDLDRKEFLILLGAINTMVMTLSFITLYAINKPRTGAAVAMSKILTAITLSNLAIILLVIFVSGIIAFFLTIFLAKIFSKNITRVKYHKISLAMLILLFVLVAIFSGWLGIIIFITSTFLGLTCVLLGIRRIHLMGCLLVVSIIHYI
jgi:putative membrane protein